MIANRNDVVLLAHRAGESPVEYGVRTHPDADERGISAQKGVSPSNRAASRRARFLRQPGLTARGQSVIFGGFRPGFRFGRETNAVDKLPIGGSKSFLE